MGVKYFRIDVNTLLLGKTFLAQSLVAPYLVLARRILTACSFCK